ncbi:MAG TPA: NADH dehydrogenase (quinone) subunit D [Terriglobia bacterium]|nr:NADH dehydrogenase (quinone) subunit D [Terriglobia bacterium]
MAIEVHEEVKELTARSMLLNVGPSHPAMHGVIRIVTQLDGETVVKADVEIGYLHRGFEKSCEEGGYNQAIPYTDRLNYVSPLINNFGYCMAVEKLMGIEITERCRFIRVIMSEISRVTDHLTCVGASAMEVGAMTVFLYMIKAREYLWELIEDVTGARLTISYGRVGGLSGDLPEGFSEKARTTFKKVREVLVEVDKLLSRNRIFVDRMKGVGVISREDAIAYGFAGPMARSVGIDLDLRRDQPYLVYDRLKFDVPLGEVGDNLDRYYVRMKEMEQSLRIAEQALAILPGGAVSVDATGKAIEARDMVDRAKVGQTRGILETLVQLSPNLEGLEDAMYRQVQAKEKRAVLPAKRETYGNIEGLMNHFMLIMDGQGIRPPKGEAYAAVEGANGELGFYVVSDGTDRPYRVRVRAPCFALMSGLHKILEGYMVADMVPTFGSVNMIAGELDR